MEKQDTFSILFIAIILTLRLLFFFFFNQKDKMSIATTVLYLENSYQICLYLSVPAITTASITNKLLSFTSHTTPFRIFTSQTSFSGYHHNNPLVSAVVPWEIIAVSNPGED